MACGRASRLALAVNQSPCAGFKGVHSEQWLRPMPKKLSLALLMLSALGLAACDKTSEDHVQKANEHTEAAAQKQAEGKPEQAAEEKAEAAEEHDKAREKRVTEDRHQALSSDVPDEIKAPEKK